jgi:hypothetical protein
MIDDQKMIVDLTNNVSKKFINCLAEWRFRKKDDYK